MLGVDLGTVRIGLAVSDPSGMLASPLAILNRSGDEADDHRAIVAAARERSARRCIVVGLPRPPAGQDRARRPGRCSTRSRRSPRLAHAEGVEVDTYDERFTTMIAEQGLRETKAQEARASANIDAAAATVILQSWLEAPA